MYKVLYIAGDGRSGSTLLNIALGNHDQVLAMGELCNVHRFVLGQENWCSCGLPVSDCDFWQSVEQRLLCRDSAGTSGLQQRFESNRAALLWPWWHYRRRQAESFEYRSRLREVLKAVADVSRASLIVDASKLPGRAMALSLMPDVEFYLVHLVRDARALVWSRSKSWKQDLSQGIEADVPARSTSLVCANWCKANLLTTWVRRRIPKHRSIRLRYEDFATNPVDSLRRIGQLVQLDFTAVAERLQAGVPLEKGHTGSGNRMRMQEVKLKPDFGWTQNIPQRTEAITWALTGQIMRRYGYQRAVGVAG